MDNPLSNVYTDRDFQYLKSKSLDVCIVVRHRGTKEVTMRSSVPHSEAVKMIRGMENTKEDTWVTEAQKNRFPKSPEPLEDILNCKPKIQKLASKLMSFWNSEVRGRQAMGVGEFKAWNDFEFDLGKTHFLINQFDKIRNDVDKLCPPAVRIQNGLWLNVGKNHRNESPPCPLVFSLTISWADIKK